jgi:hypothetical protein
MIYVDIVLNVLNCRNGGKFCQGIANFVKVGQKYQNTLHGAPVGVYSNVSVYCCRKDRSFRRMFYTE